MIPSATITGIEYELVVRDCPPHSCACRCPAYNRDPCAACVMRDVLSIDIQRIEP